MENETRFSRKYQYESRESHESRKKGNMQHIVKLASLAIFVSLAFASLTNKQSHNSQREISVRLKILVSSLKTPESKLVMILASLAAKFLFQKFVCETREKRVLLQKFLEQDS